MDDKRNLSSKVAIVTGGSRGIGRAVVLKLAERGAKVVVNYRSNATAAAEVMAAIKARDGEGLVQATDISQPQEVAKLVETALTSYGKIDILVNNAGITRDGLILRLSEGDWDEVLATNLKGAFLCTKAVLRPMIRQRWGRIVNIASVVGIIGNAGQANYAAAKAGLIGLTRATAREVASRGITVNAIAPGFIKTEMTQSLSEAQRQELLKQIPFGYFGSPEDVAATVAFLSSEEAAYITGQVLNIDGGMVMA
ncbi:MAG: 3-oxoacyl-[acyl-carrier-protein] reductase [Chloroflexi bacterium]|nr:3-oxoacyl-[acyl-carrier-protein] reductase [Chloroflexota bacterium]